MEKYARQAVSEGLQRSEDIHVNKDSEIYRVLNLHYNRNNHIEVIKIYNIADQINMYFKIINSVRDRIQRHSRV